MEVEELVVQTLILKIIIEYTIVFLKLKYFFPMVGWGVKYFFSHEREPSYGFYRVLRLRLPCVLDIPTTVFRLRVSNNNNNRNTARLFSSQVLEGTHRHREREERRNLDDAYYETNDSRVRSVGVFAKEPPSPHPLHANNYDQQHARTDRSKQRYVGMQ